MKKLLTLIVLVVFTMFGYAQTAKVGGTEESIKNMIGKNYVEFVFPDEITQETIEKSGKYYTEYFTVEYNKPSKIVKVSLIENTDMARRVITRFLLSCGVRTVEFTGKEFTIMEFYDSYLK
ncbi:MAG: hypothetical protein H3C31_07195 [Brumimicrobium sp.]|nr:hypothetical protein [Brumimicrobium sp.]MCO5267842.1 hypothetical protein [Brumimicrobium sp.]